MREESYVDNGEATNEQTNEAESEEQAASLRTDGESSMAVEGAGENATISEFVENSPAPQHPCTNCGKAFDTGPALGGHLANCRPDSDRPWTDPELLEELYNGEDLRLHEIADRFEVDYRTVWRSFDRFDIERDEAPQNHPGVRFETYLVGERLDRGYERWVHSGEDGSRQTVRISQLAAVAWFGFDEVVGNDVHHDLPIPWINFEANLQALDHAEHSRLESRRCWESEDKIDHETPGYDWAGIER